MVKEETKEIAKYIGVLIFLSALMITMLWAIVFARYGDHVKYNADLVLGIFLVIGIFCYFIALGLAGYMMLRAYVQAKDEELDKIRASYFELTGKKI